MKTHKLKIEHEFFEAVKSGGKTFEIRFNDRNFQKGDKLILKEFCSRQYTGGEIKADISYVLSGYGLEDGYVALGLKNVKEIK